MSERRLPRITLFYRAYPEFDHLSESACENLIVQARVRRGDAGWFVPLAIGLCTGLAAGGMLLMLAKLILTAVGGKAQVAGASAPGPNIESLEKVLMGAVAVLTVVAVIVVYSLLRRAMLVRTMRRIIARAVCPFCDFSLVGLFVERGSVRCPECGGEVVLAEHRIHEDDLIPSTPEGLRAMRERWKNFGADKYGALSGGKPEPAGPQGQHRQTWNAQDLKAKLAARSGRGQANGPDGDKPSRDQTSGRRDK